MNNTDENFSAAESLQVIRSMIETTKHSISDNSHFFLLWGYATLIGCSLQFFLMSVLHFPKHYYAWFVTPVAVLLHVIMLYRYRKEQRVKTFISEANAYVWTIIGFSFMALGFVFSKIGWQYSFPIYMMLYGIGTYISGSLINFTPMRLGGLVCLFLVVIAPYVDYQYQILLCAIAILVSYIIPGHLLRNEYRRTQKHSNA